MDVRLRGFGSIEVQGQTYEHDVVIDRGIVRKRSKKPSKPYRDKFGHTPLSADEELPWGGPRLIIGTGAHGSLPIMPEVVAEAAHRNIDLVIHDGRALRGDLRSIHQPLRMHTPT